MKKFKNEFQVTGPVSLRKALAEELKKIGYKFNDFDWLFKHYEYLVHPYNGHLGEIGVNHSYYQCPTYTLPQDWYKVLALAKEEDLPEVEYVKCVYDDSVHAIKGLVFKVDSCNNGRFASKEVADKLNHDEWADYPFNGFVWKFEPATKEEYEAQNKKQDLPEKKWKIREFGAKGKDRFSYDDMVKLGIAIHSVTDGEQIIAVGDVTNHGRVRGFTIYRGNLNNIIIDKDGVSMVSNIESLDLKKVEKKPLFVTEDGVEVYKGDEYFKVREMSEITPVFAFSKIYTDDYIKLTFSSREVAEEYILHNKPVLSLKDCWHVDQGTYHHLKNLVKQRIK
jgi:hypothetical protein